MSSEKTIDEAPATLDNAVRETLAYFDGPGRSTKARVQEWEARDVLMHFIYFHEATAWGIQSVAIGGPLWQVPTDSDTVNEVCRILHEGESLDELLVQVRQAHTRLQRAITKTADLDQPCLRRDTGEVMTAWERIEAMAVHWANHLRELRAVETR